MKFSCFKKNAVFFTSIDRGKNHKKVFPCFLGKPLSLLVIFVICFSIAEVRVLFTSQVNLTKWDKCVSFYQAE